MCRAGRRSDLGDGSHVLCRGQDRPARVGRGARAEWQSQSGRVFYVPVHEEGERKMREILASMDVPASRMTPTDDAPEILAVAGDRVRRDRLEDDIAAVASAELGQRFIDGKVEAAVASIRAQVGS